MDFNATEQNITWFRDRYQEGNLTIKPPFQRNPVWLAAQKHYLIELILKNFPIPEIYVQQIIHTEGEGRTEYAIVDGQQRIRTVLQFIGVESDATEEEWNGFALEALDPSSEWKNVSFMDLTDVQRRKLLGYRFAVRFLDTDSDIEVRNAFERLNRYQTPLNNQELRNARYVGPFKVLVGQLADQEYWSENRITSPAIIRRMLDVEYISELLIGSLHGPQGAGVIDKYYELYEKFETEFPGQPSARLRFDDTLRMIQQILPDIKEYRWHNRVDFYTLFVALAILTKTHKLPEGNVHQLRDALIVFGHQVNMLMLEETFPATSQVTSYVAAVIKGVTDKARRADRHEALVETIEPFFERTAPLIQTLSANNMVMFFDGTGEGENETADPTSAQVDA